MPAANHKAVGNLLNDNKEYSHTLNTFEVGWPSEHFLWGSYMIVKKKSVFTSEAYFIVCANIFFSYSPFNHPHVLMNISVSY